MADPVTIAAGASAIGGMMGYKGNMAAARSAEQVAQYNAKIKENEAIMVERATRDHERNLRINSERIKATQRVMAAASGVQMSGSPLIAQADAYFKTEEDAARIRSAGSAQAADKLAAASLIELEGQAQATALKTQAMGSLLTGAYQASNTMRT